MSTDNARKGTFNGRVKKDTLSGATSMFASEDKPQRCEMSYRSCRNLYWWDFVDLIEF